MIYLHPGLHKTGTTSIQECFQVYRRELISHSINAYPHNAGNLFIYDRKKQTPSILSGQGLQINKRYVQSNIKAFKSNAKTHVISAEVLSWLFEEEQIQNLFDAIASSFDDIKVIFYIRRQDKLLFSFYQQGMRAPFSLNNMFFDADKIRPTFDSGDYDQYLNYRARIESWAKVFGEKNIIIRVMDTDTLIGNDSVLDFLSILDCQLPYQSIKLNQSSGLELTKLRAIYSVSNQSKIAATLLRQIISTKKFVPDKETAMNIYNGHREDNILLNKRFKIHSREVLFNENFDEYSEKGSFLWDDKTASSAITQLFENISNLGFVHILLEYIRSFKNRLRLPLLKFILLRLRFFYYRLGVLFNWL